MLRSIATVLALFLMSTVAASQTSATNVILFLADAAGLPTLHAASIHGHGAPQRLFVQRMPWLALSDTSTASEWVTDSAAGMTAIVTGQRTNNGVLGQSAQAVRGAADGAPLKTILEYAEERGLATGIVTNDGVTGATPAALYAKSNDRDAAPSIFAQLLTPRFGDGPDVVIAAGRRQLEQALATGGQRLDGVTSSRGRTIHARLDDVGTGDARALVLLDDDEFDVTAATRLAIRILRRNPRGYFLMVESDAHTDRVRHGLDRMVAFDRTIESIAGEAGPDTLVLFTADHSFDLRVHGGLRREPLLKGLGAGADPDVDALALPAVRMNDSHTGEEVLVAAQGPGAERVRGFLPNTRIFEVMMAAFGWAP